MESVHVELPNKRLKVGVFEIAWEYFLCKCLMVMYDEAIAFSIPADDVFKTVILPYALPYLEYFVGFEEEATDSAVVLGGC